MDAAVRLGLDSFTMLGLAEDLGISPATLYSHVAGRDEVIALVESRLHGTIREFATDATEWRGWLADFAALVRDVLSGAGQGKVTPYDLLSDAYRQKRRRTMQEPARVAKWQAGISTLADLYLTARPGSTAGSHRLATPRLRPILLATIDLFKNRVSAHGAAQDTRRWVSESLYPDIERALNRLLLGRSKLLGA